MPERSRFRFARLRRRRHVIRYGRVVRSDELVCPEWCPDADLSPSWHAHINADIAVAVAILDDVLEPDLHDRPIFYAATSSHGFIIDGSLLGSASNAASSFNLSQTVRELMRFGPGILPSLTIRSNKDGEMPT